MLFSDTKLNIYGLNGTVSTRWDKRINELVSGIKSRGLKLHFISISIGFAGSLLSSDVHLTTGYPIRNQEVKVVNNKLQAITSSNFINGGFENFSDNVPANWGFQDTPGDLTFIDNQIKRSGNASFRAEAKGDQNSRILTAFDVKPFHQYTLKCWIKTENLTAANVLALIRDNNKDRNLTNLRLSTPKPDGDGRRYFNRPNSLSLDWTEVRIAFNSLNATSVNLALAVFGGQNGTI
ncbi:hypothetical protein [Aquimarina agarivorans]|uniref:hypothetical protein n=1 Tax=Aquimarina agarivorans TaxID=980584 RepID=UPI0002E81AB5|nr:hypothetical protein [Aquimarina agarivorans]